VKAFAGAGQAIGGAGGVVADHPRTRLHGERRDVVAQRGDGGFGALDEHRRFTAARKRFEPHRARAGVEVERSGARRGLAENVEHRLADLVGGWTGGRAARRAQPSATELAADDSHRPDVAWALRSVKPRATMPACVWS